VLALDNFMVNIAGNVAGKCGLLRYDNFLEISTEKTGEHKIAPDSRQQSDGDAKKNELGNYAMSNHGPDFTVTS
jgi:hypothetical protein